jgi:hypothetical protein
LKEKLGKTGRVPDVSLEPTTLGPDLDEAVLNAKRQMRIGADRDYDLVYDKFDVMHYLLQTPRLIERPRLDLIKHFLETGVASMRSPDIHFSMSEYLTRHPERAQGRERSPYLEWLDCGSCARRHRDGPFARARAGGGRRPAGRAAYRSGRAASDRRAGRDGGPGV